MEMKVARSLVLASCACLLAGLAAGEEICLPTDSTCKFHLKVKLGKTMRKGGDQLYAQDARLFRYDAVDPSIEDAVDPDGVIIADGWERTRLVTLANGELPGPPIIVYKGQEVIVFVENDLEGRETTIHWHGLDQRGTPWMDGVPYINQCPINGLQRFKYRFIADEAGTFWWHSHIGSQRSDGLYGALIVKEREEVVENQHIMIVQEWNHDGDADHIRENIGATFDGRIKWSGFRTLDNLSMGPYRAHSILINGRARFSDDNVTIDTPLTRFMVEEGEVYRFRVITAAAFYPILISVDNHQIELIATDGKNIKTQPCDSFIIYPGERFDFLLHANQEPDIYWIRALLAVTPFSRAPLGEAILKYNGAPGRYPRTSPNCTAGCNMANCPYDYKSYQPYPNTSCISMNKLRGGAGLPSTPQYEAGNFRQFFLNFGFVQGSATVNGRVFKSPTVNIYTQPKDVTDPCDEVCTDEVVCRCFHVIKFPGGSVVQIVLTNLVGSTEGSFQEPHPIHIHGHQFHVVKIGFPTYNETSGEIIAATPDIVCEHCDGSVDRNCREPQWADSSWTRNLPGIPERPPMMDTVAIPSGGYVVLRFVADNPGVWNAHCHMEPHNINGMRFVMNESFPEQPEAPEDLPKCGNYPMP